jgi:hypothetical protein
MKLPSCMRSLGVFRWGDLGTLEESRASSIGNLAKSSVQMRLVPVRSFASGFEVDPRLMDYTGCTCKLGSSSFSKNEYGFVMSI